MIPAAPGDLRFVIAGLGSIGGRHFRNLKELGHREIAVYRETDRESRALSDEEIPTFRSLDDAFDYEPDCVLVTNPTQLHVPLALEVARHGVHLFIEIPLSHELEGTDELVETAERNGLLTLMGFNLRFHPCVQALRQLVVDGAVGRVVSVQARCGTYLPGWHPWEDYRQSYAARRGEGGGAILAAGVHELDYLRWIFGPVEQVVCVDGTRSGLDLKDVEDTASITLAFASSVIGHLHVDLVQRPYNRGCRIVGDEGSLRWDFKENRVRHFDPDSEAWSCVVDHEYMDYNETYVEEMRHLVKCLRGKASSVNDVAEGRANLRLALAAKRSAERRCFVKPEELS